MITDTLMDEQVFFTVSAQMIETFNRVTGERHNLSTEANGLIAINQLQQAVHEAVGTTPHTYLTQSFKFRNPVHADDKLYVTTTILDRVNDKITLAAVVYNHHNQPVIECESIVLV